MDNIAIETYVLSCLLPLLTFILLATYTLTQELTTQTYKQHSFYSQQEINYHQETVSIQTLTYKTATSGKRV